MPVPASLYGPVSLGVVAAVLGAFTVIAGVIAHRMQYDTGFVTKHETEQFITARRQVGRWRVAWSFFAGSLGAWLFVLPVQQASTAGLLGIGVQAAASGIAVLLVVYTSSAVQKYLPYATSMTEYIGWRFGPLARFYIMLLVFMNLASGLLMEYAVVAALFEGSAGRFARPAVIALGASSLIYSLLGGLYSSVVTRHFQGVTAVFLSIVVGLYAAATFRHPLPKPLPPGLLGTTALGYASVVTVTATCWASRIFNEGMWQSCWASQSKSSLWFGAVLGASATSVVVFAFGCGGLIASWAGLQISLSDPSLQLFALLDSPHSGGLSDLVSAQRALAGHSWACVAALMVAATFSQAAVSHMQLGLTGAVTSYFFRDQSLHYTRFASILVNVPLIYAGMQIGLGCAVKLLVLAGILCCTALLPFLLGFSSLLSDRYTGDIMFSASIISGLSTSTFGIIMKRGRGLNCILDGLQYAWFNSEPHWQTVAVALSSSVIGALVSMFISWLWVDILGRQGCSLSRFARPLVCNNSEYWDESVGQLDGLVRQVQDQDKMMVQLLGVELSDIMAKPHSAAGGPGGPAQVLDCCSPENRFPKRNMRYTGLDDERDSLSDEVGGGGDDLEGRDVLRASSAQSPGKS